MDLNSWHHYTKLQESLAQTRRTARWRRRRVRRELDALREEVEHVSIVMRSILHHLDEKGLVTREDVTDSMASMLAARIAELDETEEVREASRTKLRRRRRFGAA